MLTTLYYEKIGLTPDISRNLSGVRIYSDKNISRLGFIKRAQGMNFSLDEIKSLLSMREDPQYAKDHVRKLTFEKLEQIESQLSDLLTLRNELKLLLNLCQGSQDGCPIIEGLEGEA